MSSTISITYKLQGDAKTFKELTNQADGLKKAFEGVTVEAEQLPKKMGGLKSLASGLVKSLGGLAAGVVSVRAFVRVVGNAVNVMKDFERANSELASVLGKSTKDIAGLTQAATELGKTTSFTASEVTELQTALARLGFSENQIVAMQESVLKFAAAVGTDLASAADFSGSALRSFGMKASEAKPLLDMMAASCSKSALSFSKLQTSLSIVGPVANAFGLTARDTVAMLGVMSNAGFDASSAATSLRNILLNLADSNGKLAKGLGHTAKTMPEIIAALKELNERGVDLNTTLGMTDKRSVAAFNALLSGADDVEELYEALGDANGALDQMYNTMEDNLEGATNRLKSAWQDFALSLRDDVLPVLKGLYNWLAKVFLRLSDINKAGLFRFRAQKTNRKLDEYTEQYAGDPEGLQKAIDDMTERYNQALGPVLKKQIFEKLWLLKEVQTNQQLAASARESEEALGGLTDTEESNGNAAAGAASKKKTLTDAIDDYRKSVANAVVVNRAFGAATNAVDSGLSVMRASLAAVSTQYGTESEAVKALASKYDALARARQSGADYATLSAALKEMEDGITALVQRYGAESQAVRDLAASYAALKQASSDSSARSADLAAIDVQLKAMESGISSLIGKYGAESDAVKALIQDYYDLLKARRDSSVSYDALGPVTRVSGSAEVRGKKAEKNGSIPGLAGKELRSFGKDTANAMTQAEALQGTLGALGGVFRDLAGAVGESAAAWLDWASNLVSSIAQALPQLTALFVKQNAAATANTAAAASGGASAVASIPYVGPVLAVAAVASILAALANLPKFAKGGVVSGPTIGLMGEYTGAANNPEVIAPLNTLRQYIQPGGIAGDVRFRIRGRDLEGVLDTEVRRGSRS